MCWLGVGVLDTNFICSHSLLPDVSQSLCQHPELLQSQNILRVCSEDLIYVDRLTLNHTVSSY